MTPARIGMTGSDSRKASQKKEKSISKKGKKLTDRFNAYTEAYAKAYLNLPAKPVTDPEKKREKTNAYVEGLLKNGGPSTDTGFGSFTGDMMPHLRV